MLNLVDSLQVLLSQPNEQAYIGSVATVVRSLGSVARPIGTSMLVTPSKQVRGTISNGCIEATVIEASLEAIKNGKSRWLNFGCNDLNNDDAKLSCGGSLEVFIAPICNKSSSQAHRSISNLNVNTIEILANVDYRSPIALIRRIDSGHNEALVITDFQKLQVGLGRTDLAQMLESESLVDKIMDQLKLLIHNGKSDMFLIPKKVELDDEPIKLFVESRLSPARFIIFGANDFSAALLLFAKQLGYRVTLCEMNPALYQQPCFEIADEIVTTSPYQYLTTEAERSRLDKRSVICVLNYDLNFDTLLLKKALDLEVGYLGAMGSRHRHAQRVKNLRAIGTSPQQLIKLHSPIGLDLGAISPTEVAVSIVAEILTNCKDKSNIASLRNSSGPIHRSVSFD